MVHIRVRACWTLSRAAKSLKLRPVEWCDCRSPYRQIYISCCQAFVFNYKLASKFMTSLLALFKVSCCCCVILLQLFITVHIVSRTCDCWQVSGCGRREGSCGLNFTIGRPVVISELKQLDEVQFWAAHQESPRYAWWRKFTGQEDMQVLSGWSEYVTQPTRAKPWRYFITTVSKGYRHQL